MSNNAFVFPGQGSQYVGMGKDFYENSHIAREVYDLASDVTGLDIKKLCFEENDQLNITEFTQIAMLATEAAIFKCVEHEGIEAVVTGGLSLGEYGALIASGAMSLRDAFKIVRKRGIYMQEAVPTGGAMSAILALDEKEIEKICEETEGIVSIANYNCPGQIVITGEEAAVKAAGEKCSEAGAKRVVPLKVSGPFHSKMLEGAGEKLGKALEDVEFGKIKIPYIANLNADHVYNTTDIKPLLIKQVSSSVRWTQSVERMIAEDKVDTFIEMGPGKTISGFVKKIDREKKTISIQTYDDFLKAMEELKNA